MRLTPLSLAVLVPAILLTAVPSASATQLTSSQGLLACTSKTIATGVELQMCGAADIHPSDPYDYLYGSADITAYKVTKSGGKTVRTQDNDVQVSVDSANLTATINGVTSTCGGQGYPNGPAAGYQSNAARGFCYLDPGSTYVLQGTASYKLWQNGAVVQTWNLTSPKVTYKAPPLPAS